MCGIFGSIGFDPDRNRIDIVAHRGPDGAGWSVHDSPAGPVALGHRRLAIIDTTDAGLQPMADPTGRYRLVYNGELYNYVELRAELAARGETFRTETDSEVLLRAYAVWGEAALDRFRGMFAFLIWDERDKRLFAARDRFGIKPLYWTASHAGVAFASEIKQFLGLPSVPGRMNLPRIHDFLASGIADHTAETMFDGVMQLRAGECATVEARGGPLRVKVRRWYRIPPHDTSRGLTEREAAERFKSLLAESVRLHLRSDVTVGSCLSGGLDSSSIVCLMAPMLAAHGDAARVHTVSACYDEKSVDEKPFMDAVVAHTGVAARFVFPRAEDVFTRAEQITWHQDEPFGSTSIFAQWCVFAEAKRAGIKVMLDGQAADEQLAGYHSSFQFYLSDLLRRGRAIALIQTLTQRSRIHGTSAGPELLKALLPLLPEWLVGILRRQHRAQLQHDWLASDAFGPLAQQPGAFRHAGDALGLPPVTDLATLCLNLVFASNLQMLLHWEDRNSMAHSIEARVPFADHPLVEFSLSLGNAHKIVGAQTKRVLRRAMDGTIPDRIRDRNDKLGFATPEQAWFRGPLKSAAREGVEATLSTYPGLLNAAGTRRLVDDMLEGRRPVDFLLWRIINLGLWGRRFGVSLS